MKVSVAWARFFTVATSVLPVCRIAYAGDVPLPSYPLAVKSPYLSTWVPGNQLTNAATAQPEFWFGQNLTWPVLARVNGKTYSVFGAPSGIPNVTAARTDSVSYTSSHTLIHSTAGEATVTLDFFTPVLPRAEEYARQSLPYSYLTVSASSTDGRPTAVQVLSGIDQTWTAQNGAANLNFTTADNAGYFQFYNPSEIQYTEFSDMATYGSIVFGASTDPSVTRACAAASVLYDGFVSYGNLQSPDSCGNSDLAALSRDLGTTSGSASPSVTFAVGFDRPQAIDYLGNAQTGLYRSKWPTIPDALGFFLGDYSSASDASNKFDQEVRSRASAVSTAFGSQYADIVEASVRQSFAAMEITVPADNLAATPSVYLKEISSDGNVNTVDVIYQSWPIFVSLNPEYIRMMFQPFLSYLQAGRWPHPYVIHDMGFAYPNATGHDNGNAESMPLFETSTLFILLYTYQKYTGDTTWAQQYLGLLEGYAEYLAANTLYPASQLISVDAINAAPNQTALAIQSVIGLKAASIVTGNNTYATLADSYAKTIYDDGLGLDGSSPADSTHFTYYYGQSATWNVVFAAFSDVLLNLSTFPSSAWEMQSKWYLSQMQQGGLPFAGPSTDLAYTGRPLTWGLSDWNIVAAGASSDEVQNSVINTTYAFLTNGLHTVPFVTKYQVVGDNIGQWIGNKARSTVGSNFALLALAQGTWGTSH